MIRCRAPLFLAALVCMAAVVGCQGARGQAKQRESSHLRALVTLFNYAERELGHRPANEAELKSFVSSKGQAMMASLKVSRVDDLFVSERDGQPFVVMYGAPPKGDAKDIVAYEQVGQGGKRMVGYSLGAIAEVDNEQLAKIAPPVAPSGK